MLMLELNKLDNESAVSLRAPAPSALSVAASLVPRCRLQQTSSVLMLAPVSIGCSWPIAEQLADAFQHTLDGRVLVLGLGTVAKQKSRRGPVSNYELWSSIDIELSMDWPYLDRDGASEPVLATLNFPETELAVIVSSAKFRSFLDKLRMRFKLILLAGSTFSACPSSLLAAQLSDGVIISVRRDESTLREVKTAQAMATRVHSQVLGFILETEAPARRKH